MRILHTSDWHLNDRLYWVDRQPDIKNRLQELAVYLQEHAVDVMVVAGDLFSQRNSRIEELQTAVNDVSEVFTPFLRRGGTIVAISGNHDSEALFKLLRSAQDLAAPVEGDSSCYPPGRMYLATRATRLPLQDRNGERVQFVLLPYPTEHRYLRGSAVHYTSMEEKHVLLRQSLLHRLIQLKEHHLDEGLPSVLVAHLHVRGSELHSLYRLGEKEDVIFDLGDLPMHWAYAAFGHIHKAQEIQGLSHMRYSGSLERMDLAERADQKCAVLVQIVNGQLVEVPTLLPVHATPIHQFEITDPVREIPALADRFPDSRDALAYYKLRYRPGEHNVKELCRDIEAQFRHCCKRELIAEGAQASAPGVEVETSPINQSMPEKVRSYLAVRLEGDLDRDEILAIADRVLAVEAGS